MKILLVSPTQSRIGGIAQHVQGLTKFLERNSHQVEIVSSENTFSIPIKGLKNPSFMISSFLKTKFKKNQDIVHAHNIPAAMAMRNTVGKKFSHYVEYTRNRLLNYMEQKLEVFLKNMNKMH